MTVVGLQINKILVEKMAPVKGKVSVNNNVAVKDVEKTDLTFGTSKQDALRFTYEFTANYEPKIAHILFEGTVTYFDTPAAIEEIHKGWKKDKKVAPDIMTNILNSILAKCNIEALLLSREVNLPPPIPMPRVKVNPPK
ncbi:MAG: hypothetical protein QXT19_04740 [Candidatus Woesearchaeota archaeon]